MYLSITPLHKKNKSGVRNISKRIKCLCGNMASETLGKCNYVNKRKAMHPYTIKNLTGNTIADEIRPVSHYPKIFLPLSAFIVSILQKHLMSAANCHLSICRFSGSL